MSEPAKPDKSLIPNLLEIDKSLDKHNNDLTFLIHDIWLIILEFMDFKTLLSIIYTSKFFKNLCPCAWKFYLSQKNKPFMVLTLKYSISQKQKVGISRKKFHTKIAPKLGFIKTSTYDDSYYRIHIDEEGCDIEGCENITLYGKRKGDKKFSYIVKRGNETTPNPRKTPFVICSCIWKQQKQPDIMYDNILCIRDDKYQPPEPHHKRSVRWRKFMIGNKFEETENHITITL